MRKLILVLAVAVALGAAVPALGQVPAVQEALFGYLAKIPSDFNAVAPAAVKTRLDAGEKIFLLDVREVNEFAEGRIPGSINVPIRVVPQNLDKLPAKDAPIVVICKSGVRAAYVTMTLSILGYANVKDLAGGFGAWQTANLPIEK